jgi:hypothetical protein
MTKIENFNEWCAALFAAHPSAKLHQERLTSGGFAKVAFVNNRVVGKFIFNGNRGGWIA